MPPDLFGHEATYVQPLSAQQCVPVHQLRGPGQRARAEPRSPVAVWRKVRGYAHVVDLSHSTQHAVRRCVGTQLATGTRRTAQKAHGHTRRATTAQHEVRADLRRRGD
jgi:hypothetical protein